MVGFLVVVVVVLLRFLAYFVLLVVVVVILRLGMAAFQGTRVCRRAAELRSGVREAGRGFERRRRDLGGRGEGRGTHGGLLCHTRVLVCGYNSLARGGSAPCFGGVDGVRAGGFGVRGEISAGFTGSMFACSWFVCVVTRLLGSVDLEHGGRLFWRAEWSVESKGKLRTRAPEHALLG